MDSIMSFLQNLDYESITTDPRVLIVGGILLVLAIIFRWTPVLLLLFAVAGTMAVLRYSRVSERSAGNFDTGLIVFVGGCIVVGVILIYFLFIRGD